MIINLQPSVNLHSTFMKGNLQPSPSIYRYEGEGCAGDGLTKLVPLEAAWRDALIAAT